MQTIVKIVVSINWLVICVHLLCKGSSDGISIALHGQLSPTPEKIVGSVITTDGLFNAFEKRDEVKLVKIFYPSQYHGFLSHQWDYLIIEGWFPSIEKLLQVTRNNIPSIKIIFFLLDPTYPGMNIITNLDFDGIISNSQKIVESLNSTIPCAKILLAADPDIMKPLNESRNYGAVYVGAGGQMLNYKKTLHEMLLQAVPYNLRLHGTHWGEVDILKDISQGPLPRFDLASAYSSAEVVLAYTIDSQREYGMVNNRIFEALACGAIVVSEYSTAVEELFPGLVMFHTEKTPVNWHIEKVLNDKVYAKELRVKAVNTIFGRHTWDHRVVEILDFFGHVSSSFFTFDKSDLCGSKKCSRSNCAKILLIVSDSLKDHDDVNLSVIPSLLNYFCNLYSIKTMTETQWLELTRSFCSDENTLSNCIDKINDYEVILTVTIPFDALDLSMQLLPVEVKVNSTDVLQRKATYLMGFDPDLVPNKSLKDTSFEHYDLIWYRDIYEVNLLEKCGVKIQSIRIQHSFGVGSKKNSFQRNLKNTTGEEEVFNEIPLVVCFYQSMGECREYLRKNMIRNHLYLNETDEALHSLLLVGGDWVDWLTVPNVVSFKILPRTTHVSSIRGRLLPVSLFSSKRRVFFMNQEELYSCDSTDSTAGNVCVPKKDLSTKNEVIWPYVLSAVQECKMFLKNKNSLVLSFISHNFQDWDEEYLERSLQVGANRLLGFPSSKASLEVELLEYGFEVNNRVKRWIEVSNTTVVGENRDDDNVLIVLFSLQYKMINIGFDGECCIYLEEKRDKMQCILRPFNFVQVKLDLRKPPSENITYIPKKVNFIFALRGFLVADETFISNISIVIPKNPSILSPKTSSKITNDIKTANNYIGLNFQI